MKQEGIAGVVMQTTTPFFDSMTIQITIDMKYGTNLSQRRTHEGTSREREAT